MPGTLGKVKRALEERIKMLSSVGAYGAAKRYMEMNKEKLACLLTDKICNTPMVREVEIIVKELVEAYFYTVVFNQPSSPGRVVEIALERIRTGDRPSYVAQVEFLTTLSINRGVEERGPEYWIMIEKEAEKKAWEQKEEGIKRRREIVDRGSFTEYLREILPDELPEELRERIMGALKRLYNRAVEKEGVVEAAEEVGKLLGTILEELGYPARIEKKVAAYIYSSVISTVNKASNGKEVLAAMDQLYAEAVELLEDLEP